MRRSAIDFKNLIAVLAVIIGIALLDSWNYLQGPKNAVLSLLSPIESKFFSSSNFVSDFFHTMGKINSFKNENEKLEGENLYLNYELSKLRESQRQEDAIRSQVKFKNGLCMERDCLDFVMGRVIGRSPESYENYVIINLGRKDGANVGQAITIQNGVMIGKIAEVFDGYSKVVLVVSPKSSINCLAQTTRANGLLRGKYGTSTKLEMIDQSEQLVPGDVVITSGLESGVPKGLLLGKISAVQQSPNMVFKTADIDLFADFGHIEDVFLAQPK